MALNHFGRFENIAFRLHSEDPRRTPRKYIWASPSIIIMCRVCVLCTRLYNTEKTPQTCEAAMSSHLRYMYLGILEQVNIFRFVHCILCNVQIHVFPWMFKLYTIHEAHKPYKSIRYNILLHHLLRTTRRTSGRHVVGFVYFCIDVFLVVQIKKYN